MTIIFANLSPDGVQCEEFIMNNSLQHKLYGSPPTDSFGQVMYKGATCDRSTYVTVLNDNNLPWPQGVEAGMLGIYQVAAGLPEDVQTSEIITYAGVNADGSECQEIETTAAFVKAYPKHQMLMKYNPTQ